MSQINKKLTNRAFFFLLFAILIGTNSYAQKLTSNTGKEFYVAFGKNDTIRTVKEVMDNKNVQLILRFTTSADTKVKLSFTENSVLDTTLFIPAGKIQDLILNTARARACYSGEPTMAVAKIVPTKKSIYVTADNPINMIAINSANHSVEASLIIPVGNLGNEYFHVGMGRNETYHNTPEAHCNGYLIIATEDDTEVKQSTTFAGDINLKMKKGEVFHYNYNTGNSWQAKGTHIVSNKPIAYFQSSTNSLIDNVSSLTSAYTFEQMPPVEQWGTKFILPTNNENAGFVRIFPKELPTTVKIKRTNHNDSIVAEINSSYFMFRYIDFKINADNNHDSKAAYIVSDKPVGVSYYNIPYLKHGYMQPGVAWLPPVEQRTTSAFVSPLDLIGEHVYMEMKHHFMIIVPTASKNATTISINGDDPRPISQLPPDKFRWIEDNIRGSGYSFGRYYFGISDVSHEPKKLLNTNALVENPDGLIMLTYGQGSYTNYMYTAAASYRNLTAGFTINGEDYINIDGKAYCNTQDFYLQAYPDSLTSIIWHLNGKEITDSQNQKYVEVKGLPDGYYTVEMSVRNKTYTTHFFVGGGAVIWTPRAKEESEKHNWHNSENWTPPVVPSSCHNVYIPGDSRYYPQLDKPGVCNKIYFMQGAELGRPDLLTYNKAHIHLNFGLSQTKQINNMSKEWDLILKSTATSDRMKYSASVSPNTLKRERWYMLSSPLRGIVTGDLSFGGFPLTFLMKFGPIEKDNQNYPVGKWTTAYNSMTEPTSAAVTDGFAYYMFGYSGPYLNKPNASDNAGCTEHGSYNTLNDLFYMPSELRPHMNYGIKEINGIIELPFYADLTGLMAHRTQSYNYGNNKSTFYYIDNGKNNPADFNKLTGKNSVITREQNNGNYRFAAEEFEAGDWKFEPVIYHSGKNIGPNEDFFVGNPYMSSIDMVKFLKDNETTLQQQFKIWNGKTFISYTVSDGKINNSEEIDNPGFIAPLQGFFLKTLSSYKESEHVAKFDVTKIATVHPPGNSNLRSGTAEENIIRIKAENDVAESFMMIGYKENAAKGFRENEDVAKLFSQYGFVPEIYALAEKIPVDINLINNREEIIVPLGIKTGKTGEIRLIFTGMDNYFKASKIELIDVTKGVVNDLTGRPRYIHSFYNEDTGIQNGRFLLRFENSTTALQNVSTDNGIIVYGDRKGIFVFTSPSDPVQHLTVYDFNGRKLYERVSDAKYYPLPGNHGQSPFVVCVVTKNNAKTVKVF